VKTLQAGILEDFDTLCTLKIAPLHKKFCIEMFYLERAELFAHWPIRQKIKYRDGNTADYKTI
jgi:hypothetical protein